MLERNKIYLGDCLEVMRDINDKSLDMIFTDLPFGTTQNKWDCIIPLDKLWEQYNRIIKNNGAIVLFAQSPFNIALGYSNIKNLKYEWVWQKDRATGHLNSKKMPMKTHENILIFYKKTPTYNPQFWESKPMNTVYKNGGGGNNYNDCDKIENTIFNSTKRYPIDILKFNTVNGQSKDKTKHPTQKPLDLCEYFIKTYSNEGETILDNCTGSASIPIACINTNRNYIGIEKDEQYYNMACKRIEKYKIS